MIPFPADQGVSWSVCPYEGGSPTRRSGSGVDPR